jgi:hypothetical protein
MSDHVTFEETGEEREIRHYCVRCSRSPFAPKPPWDADIVSRNGVAHLGSEYGHTLCGIDATGDGWWHRL